MKTKFNLLLAWCSTTLILALAGCASPREATTTDLLKQAGFKAMPATTFEKQQHLKTIKPDQFSTVKTTGGELYYVYPLHGKDLLYVGKAAQYAAYQDLRQSLQDQQATLKAERSERLDESSSQPAGSEASWEDVWSAPTDE